MNIPKAKDLQFTKLETWPADSNCNYCGMSLFNSSECHMADIELNKEKKIAHSVMLCSENCINGFKTNPISDVFLRSEVEHSLFVINSRNN